MDTKTVPYSKQYPFARVTVSFLNVLLWTLLLLVFAFSAQTLVVVKDDFSKWQNLFIGVNNEFSADFIKKIADRCDIEINPKSFKVFDHTNCDLLRTNTALNNDTILLHNWATKLESIIRSESDIPRAPVLYNGIDMKFKKTSHSTLSLLNCNFETYSTDVSQRGPIEKFIISSGDSLSFIAALQMRNNARITFIGSLQVIWDEYYVSRVKLSKNLYLIQMKLKKLKYKDTLFFIIFDMYDANNVKVEKHNLICLEVEDLGGYLNVYTSRGSGLKWPILIDLGSPPSQQQSKLAGISDDVSPFNKQLKRATVGGLMLIGGQYH